VLIAAPPRGAGGFRRPSLPHAMLVSLIAGDGFSAMNSLFRAGCRYSWGPREERFEGRSRRVSVGVMVVDGGLRSDEGGLRTALGCDMSVCDVVA